MSVVFARIKRQRIEEFSGESFLNSASIADKIPYFSKFNNQQFLFGIYDSEKKWTVMSVNFLYAAYDGKVEILRLDNETNKVYDYFSIEGNDFSEEVFLKDGRKIWMKSPELASLILNVMLMLKKVPCGTILS